MNKKFKKSLSIAAAITAGSSSSAIFVSNIVNNNDSNIESTSERKINNVGTIDTITIQKITNVTGTVSKPVNGSIKVEIKTTNLTGDLNWYWNNISGVEPITGNLTSFTIDIPLDKIGNDFITISHIDGAILKKTNSIEVLDKTIPDPAIISIAISNIKNTTGTTLAPIDGSFDVKVETINLTGNLNWYWNNMTGIEPITGDSTSFTIDVSFEFVGEGKLTIEHGNLTMDSSDNIKIENQTDESKIDNVAQPIVETKPNSTTGTTGKMEVDISTANVQSGHSFEGTWNGTSPIILTGKTNSSGDATLSGIIPISAIGEESTFTIKSTTDSKIIIEKKSPTIKITEPGIPSIDKINGNIIASNWGEETGKIENIKFSINNYDGLSTIPTATIKDDSDISIGPITVNDDTNGNYTIANKTGLKSGTYTLEIFDDVNLIENGTYKFTINSTNKPKIVGDIKVPTVPEGEPAEFTIKSEDVSVKMDKIPQGTKAMFKALDKSGILISKLETDGNISGTTITPKSDLVVPVKNVAEGFSLILEIENNGDKEEYSIINYIVESGSNLGAPAVAAIVVGSLAGATVMGGGAYWYVAKDGKSSLKTTIDSAKAKVQASKKPTDKKSIKNDKPKK